MKKSSLLFILLATSAHAIDQKQCATLAANQKENVIQNYQPLNQGSAGLCTSFALSLSVSAATNQQVSPLSIAKTVEGWNKNQSNRQAAFDKINFYGDSAERDQRQAVISETLNKKLTDGKMSVVKNGVTANSDRMSATYGAKDFSNQEMEGVSLSEISSTLAAAGKACSTKGSTFAGSSFEDWTKTGRKNYTSFTDFDETTRDSGDASILMGQISYLYDANKDLRKNGMGKENLKKVVNQAKRVCDMQVTQVVAAKLVEEAAKINPCKGEIPFGQNDLKAVCDSGAFKPQMSADQFIKENKEMLLNGGDAGFQETLRAMTKKFLKTQVSSKYADEVEGNLMGGDSSMNAYVPETLKKKIAAEEEIIKNTPASDKTHTKENAEYRLKGLNAQADMFIEKGKALLDGETNAEKIAGQIQSSLKEKTGADIQLRTIAKPIAGNPREYKKDFLSVARKDPAFNANEVEIDKLTDELVKLEGRGNTIAFEERMSKSLDVQANSPAAQAIANKLKEKIAKRVELQRNLNKKNLPPELLNSKGDLAVSFSALSAYSGKAGPEFKSLKAVSHNADLSNKLSQDIKVLRDHWSRQDKNISNDEFKARVNKIKEAISAAKLDPSFATHDKNKLSSFNVADLDKLANLNSKSPEAGNILYALDKANEYSHRDSPFDFYAKTDLDGNGTPEKGDDDNLLAHDPFKSNPYAKALLQEKTLNHEYYKKRDEILHARNDVDKKSQNDMNVAKADLRYNDLNDCLSQNIKSLVQENITPGMKISCGANDDDLIYSLTSLASLSDDTDKIIESLDNEPAAFWDNIVQCDPKEEVDLSNLNFDIYMLDKGNLSAAQRDDMMAKALEESVAKNIPLTVGMCLNSLNGKDCDAKGGDNHAMAVVGYSAKWNASSGSCEIDYKLANSWGTKCDPRVDSSAAGVTCDSTNGIITVPQNVLAKGAKQLSVVRKK